MYNLKTTRAAATMVTKMIMTKRSKAFHFLDSATYLSGSEPRFFIKRMYRKYSWILGIDKISLVS